MYKKLLSFIFTLFAIVQAAVGLENNVYVQTLNIGDEDYFIEDTSVYPDSDTQTNNSPSVQYIQNNYNYTPYTYPNYLYSGYGTYTITSPVFRTTYRPYVQTKPFAVTPSAIQQTQTPIRKKQRGAFAYNYN